MKKSRDLALQAAAQFEPRRMGRPRLSARGSTQLNIRFPDDMIEGVDAIIEGRFGQGERATIIRELVAEALEIRKKRQ